MNVVLDLDGTICFDGKTVQNELQNFLIEKIHHHKDHQLLFASARPVRDIFPVLKEELHSCHLIGGNGTMMYHQKKCQWLNPLNEQDFHYLSHYIAENQLDYMIDEEWNYSFKGNSLSELHSKVDVLKTAQNKEIDKLNKPLKVVLGNYENEDKVIRDLQPLHVDCIRYPKENCLDVTRKGINKFSGIARIIGKEKYIAFGNDLNDREMLENAAYGVCVGDSVEIQQITQEHLGEEPNEIMATLRNLL